MMDLARRLRSWRRLPAGLKLLLPSPLVIAAVPLTYVVTAILAVYLSSKTDFVVTLWPPAAILLASLLRTPIRTWPVLLLLTFLADFSLSALASGVVPGAFVVATANVSEGLLVACMVRRFANDGKWFLSGRCAVIFVLSSVVGSAAVAWSGSTILMSMDTGVFNMSWLSWAMADSLSVLTLTPFLLFWTEPALKDDLRARDMAEAAILTLLLAGATYGALAAGLPLQFLIFPLLALNTIRCGLLGATAGTVAVAAVGLWLTVQGVGPFAAVSGVDAASRVLMLQLFILAAALCAVPLAVVFMARKGLAQEVERQCAISSAALNNMAHGLCMVDAEGRLIICNRRYIDIYNVPPQLSLPGTPVGAFAEWTMASVPAGASGERLRKKWAESFEFERPYSERELPDGRIIVVNRRPLASGGWVATHEDVTEQRRAAQQIVHLANHDPLTDLPNRTFFRERLQALIARSKRGGSFALLSLDLDRFKRVNDTLGHGAGDELLKQVAARLRGIVRDSDVVTRLGGDEFAIIQASAQGRREAARLAARIVRKLSEPFSVDGNEIDIGASVGIALSPADASDAADLLRKSDLALYRAKAEGRATHCFFEAGMDDISHQRRVLESQLKAAIQKGEFELHYQPIMDLRSGTPVCFEALIRWRHPTRGLVMPDQFISAAEDTGLIVRIGEWVVREALREVANWPEQVKVAVNLSPVQFTSGNIVTVITSAAAAAGVPPHRLDVELTESVFLQGTADVLKSLKQLRSLGVGIALDDFGTGYSSLSYLRTFLFDKIKIDRSFISELAKPESYAIVHATIDLSSKLGMTTTAEGVETAEQAAILEAEGCTNIQGYFVSRALSAPQARDFLSSHFQNDQSLLERQCA